MTVDKLISANRMFVPTLLFNKWPLYIFESFGTKQFIFDYRSAIKQYHDELLATYKTNDECAIIERLINASKCIDASDMSNAEYLEFIDETNALVLQLNHEAALQLKIKQLDEYLQASVIK